MSAGDASYTVVDTAVALARLVEALAGAESVALDTEGDSLYHYYEKVCLLQVSLDSDCYIVDPLAGLDLSRFLDLLADRPLILHAADYDLRLMRATFGFRPRRPIFDTMLATQLLGHGELGLAALVERFFSTTLCKKGKKSDWSRRPLTPEQLRYASDDTRYLGPLAGLLRGELERLGRLDWHRESCEALVAATAEDADRDPDRAWRIKGLRGLDRRQLAFVRELWHWRESEARLADLPPFRILGNHQLLDLALWAAARPRDSLDRGPRLPRTCRGRRLAALRDAIAHARRMPDSQWPKRPPRRPRPEPLGREVGHRIGALRAACTTLAAELGLDPAVLAPRAALEQVAIRDVRSTPEIMFVGPLLRWQAELVAQAMRSCCSS